MTNTPDKKQPGFTILLLTVTLLLISTLFILFGAKYSMLQQKITANLYNNQQAFEAAQAGIQAAIPYFQTNYAAIVAAQSGGHLTPYVNGNTQNVSLANGSKYTFVFSNPTANNYQLITITSTGVNADGSSTRVITEQIAAYTTGMTAPTVSVMTQGDVSLFNDSSLNNAKTNSNINAGHTVSINNGAYTTTSAGKTSTPSTFGSDVQQNNASIANLSTSNFFQSVFGTSQATVQAKANYNYNGGGIDSYNFLNGINNSVIWINESGIGFTSGNVTIGSATQPVVLIIDGNMLFSGNTTIYGLVFIMNPSFDTLLFNNVTINGAIISTGNLDFMNSATENYNASVLNILPAVGGASSYAIVPASWRDF